MSDLTEHVRHIADEISAGMSAEWVAEWHRDHCDQWVEDSELAAHIEECGDGPARLDWMDHALDIEYVVSGNREYLGARILVTFGGPNIWVNTRTGTVEGA